MSNNNSQSAWARIGAHQSWANTADRTARTAPARHAFLARFEDQVDPRRELPPEERARRAAHARKAYFARLALKSAQARRSASTRREAVNELHEALAVRGAALDSCTDEAGGGAVR